MAGRNPGMIKGAAGKGWRSPDVRGKGHPRMELNGRLAVARGKGSSQLVLPGPQDDRFFQKVGKRGPAQPPAPNIVPPSCEACGNFAARLHCGRCKTALFCDEICQRRVWPTHKNVCEPPDRILSNLVGNPKALEENENHMSQEARDIADAMSKFFARGGRKAQARLRSKSASSIGSTATSLSSPRSSLGDAHSNSNAVETAEQDRILYLPEGEHNPDAHLNDEEIDAKRPAWLQRRVQERKHENASDAEPDKISNDTRDEVLPLARSILQEAEIRLNQPSDTETGSQGDGYNAREAFSHLLSQLAPEKEAAEEFVNGRPTYGCPAKSPNVLPLKTCAVDKDASRPQLRVTGGGTVVLRNGVEMPRIVLGTGGYSGLSGKEGREAMCAALRLGYRAIDTSEMNRNLLDVAWACLRTGIPRKELFIIAKIAPWNYGYARTRNAFSRQLAELRVEYVDLVLLQWPHCWAPLQADWGPEQWGQSGNWNSVQKKGSWRALEELYEEGKARAIGISNFTVDQFNNLMTYCREKPHVMQCESHPHWTNKRVRDVCRQHEVAFQGYAPFGGPDNGSGARPIDSDVVASIAECSQVSPAQVCLYWNLARNASVVVKSKVYQRLRENLQVIDKLIIPSFHLGMIDDDSERYKEYGPVYWGHGDTDTMHPWADYQKFANSFSSQRVHDLNRPPVPLAPKNLHKDSSAPQPPPSAYAPGDIPPLHSAV